MTKRLLLTAGLFVMLVGCPSDRERAGDTDSSGAEEDVQSTDSSADDGSDGVDAGSACGSRTNYVEVYPPDVYFVFDRSDSMAGQKLTQAKEGLDEVADTLAGRARVGLAGFPLDCCCSSKELLELGEHDASSIKEAYGDLSAAGGTPTGIALFQLRQGERLEDPGDPNADRRSRAVVLVTDGAPNDPEICDSTVKDAVTQAEKIASGESGPAAPVYVVGFQSEANPEKLNAIAEAGGTDAPGENRFYSASDGESLSEAILEIADRDVACSRKLEGTAPEGASLVVDLGDERVPNDPDNGVTLEHETGTVQFHGEWCEKLQQRAGEGATLGIRVTCPDCTPAGESCSADGECCRGSCDEGTCQEGCQSAGGECADDSDCCSNTCAVDDGPIGQCVGS